MFRFLSSRAAGGFAVSEKPDLRKKPGLKAKAERVSQGLATHYSEAAGDLGNIKDYGAFLEALRAIFAPTTPPRPTCLAETWTWTWTLGDRAR